MQIGLMMIVKAFRLMAGLGYSSLNAGERALWEVLCLDALQSDATEIIPISSFCQEHASSASDCAIRRVNPSRTNRSRDGT